MQEVWVRSLQREDPLEEEMATHSSILAWEIPCTEEPGGLQSVGSQRAAGTERTLTVVFLSFPLTVSINPAAERPGFFRCVSLPPPLALGRPL